MGRAKDEKMRQDELGYSSIGDKYVCSYCFSDYAIKDFIVSEEKTGNCSYCYNQDVVVADFDHVIAFIMEGVRTEWGNPVDEGIAWESQEGGWQWDISSTADVLFGNIGLEVGERLQEDILQSTGDNQWVKKDPYVLAKDKALMFGWEGFSELVKHQARYVFFRAPSTLDEYSYDEIDPVSILEQIAYISDDLNLIQALTAGTKILRIRVTKPGESLSFASELGTPPIEYATFSNRMSPAGIPMFYGAFEYQTALKETYTPVSGATKNIVCGTFELKTDMHALDLTSLPDIPSIFDEEERYLRSAIIFFHEFVKDLSKSVLKDDREHIEYVPTQIVTEYFKHLFHHAGDDNVRDRVYGIIYPSSQHDGGKACVLFASNEQCVDKGGSYSSMDVPILELINISEEKLSCV